MLFTSDNAIVKQVFKYCKYFFELPIAGAAPRTHAHARVTRPRVYPHRKKLVFKNAKNLRQSLYLSHILRFQKLDFFVGDVLPVANIFVKFCLVDMHKNQADLS